MTGGWKGTSPSYSVPTHVPDSSLYAETTSHGSEWERVNRAEERHARMCVCGKGWGEDTEGSGGNGV